MKGDREIAKPE
jgi:hypothetical protein